MKSRRMSQFGLIGKAWRESFNLLMTNPQIMIPFFVVAIIELIMLFIIFVVEQPPLVTYIRPIIVRFWSEQYLHFPLNLLLLSKLFYYVQTVLALTLGTFMSGITINAVYQYSRKRVLSFQGLFLKTLKSYAHLLIITGLVFFLIQICSKVEMKVLYKIMSKGQSFLSIKKDDWVLIFILAGVIFSGVVQSLFIFALPSVLIGKKNFILGIFENIVLVFKNSMSALVVVVIPLMLYVPIALLKGRLFMVMDSTIPEIVFIILIAGIILSMLINVFITISATRLYLLLKDKDSYL